MAVPNQPTPTWRSIPNQSVYPSQRISLNLRNYQTRQDATITLTRHPAWVTYTQSGLHRTLNIAPPSGTVAQDYTITLSASAFVTSSGTTETRTVSFTVTVQDAVAPAYSVTAQAVQAGVPQQINLSQFLNANTGVPAPTYSFQQGFDIPEGVSLEGHLLAVVLPVANYTAPTTAVDVFLRGDNVAGGEDFRLTLNVARSVLPGFGVIPAQYAVQGEAFSLNLSGLVTGSPAPTIASTGLPNWMSVNGYILSGTPSGYTQNTTVTLDITAQNAAGDTTANVSLHIRVFSDTFTEPSTGSPITVAHNNLTALAATRIRLYYGTSDDVGKVHAVQHDGTAESGETISIPAAGAIRGDEFDVRGLATDDAFLYVLGGFNSEYVWKYTIADSSATPQRISVAGPANAIAVPLVNGHRRLAVMRTSGVVQFWSTDFSSATPLPLLAFQPMEDGVEHDDWKSMFYDELDGKLYIGEENGDKSFLYAFTPGGDRDQDEAVRLDTANTEPRGAGYENDDIYVAQGDSGQSTGRVYLYSSVARVLPVPAQFVYDSESKDIPLTPYLANDITVSFASGYTPPSWLTLDSNTLKISGAQHVVRSRQDDDYTIQLTGTHATRSTNFSVQLTVRYIEIASWSVIPSQTLDQNVSVSQPVSPPLVTSFTLHLTDYIRDLARSGSLTFAVTDQENSGLRYTLTEREVNGIRYNDVLTVHSQSTLSMQQDVASFSLRLQATNVIGTANAELSIDVNVLSPAYLNAIPAQDVQRDEIDTISLRRYAGGRPAPTFALGVITPTLTDDVATIISNANGQWSIHPNSALETTSTYTVNVVAINRISRANRSFQLTIHGVPHSLPNIAPVWHTSGLTFDINVGETQQIDLSTLVAMSRPMPTFSISSSDLVNFGGTTSINGNILTVTIPEDIDQDVRGDVEVSAQNAAGGEIGTLTFNIHYVREPAWSIIPHQEVRPGETWQLDLNTYVVGQPTPSITFEPEPTGDQANATLANGLVSWVVPDTITDDVVKPFTFRATNSQGHTDTTIGVSVVTDTAPVWVDDAILLSVREGAKNTPFDLGQYLTAGRPTPSLYLGDIGAAPSAGEPPWLSGQADLSFAGTQLQVTPTTDNTTTLRYMFNVVARNTSGTATKTIELDIHPVFEGNDFVLSASDYEQIRKLVDTALTNSDIPDEVIAADSIVGGAVAWAIDRMPIYESHPRTLEELTSKRRAVIYRAAGILATSIRQTQDPRFIEQGVSEFQLRDALYAEAEVAAVIAQDRFVKLGLADEVMFDEITFEVVGC